MFCLLGVIAGLSGCGGEKAGQLAPDAAPGIELTSSAFDAGARIPKRYTCDGDDVPPPLAWAKVPSTAKTLALLVEDRDGTYVHWTVYAIPPDTRASPEGMPPTGAKQGENSSRGVGYAGPCPSEGAPAHRYVFSLYALRENLDLKQGAEPDEVRGAIEKHAIARGRLVGTFKRG